MRKIYTLDEIEDAFKSSSSVTQLRKDHKHLAKAAQKRGLYASLRDKYNLTPLNLSVKSDKDLRLIAAKYSTRNEFKLGDSAACRMAQRRKIIDSICSHMPSSGHSNGYWDFDKCCDAALKCDSYKEFRRRFKGALRHSELHGFYSEISSHFKSPLLCNYLYCKRLSLYCTSRKEMDQRGGRYAGVRGAIHANGWHELLDHMEYLDSVCDGDTIYILSTDQMFQGNAVFKIGVTSQRLGGERFKQLRRASGFTLHPILHAQTTRSAFSLERRLHKIGTHPPYKGFDGCSEYRAWDMSEFREAIEICEKSVVLSG